MSQTLQAFESYAVFDVLDALQIRADNQIFSKESDLVRTGCEDRLNKTFGVRVLNNVTVDLVLKEVHHNYMRLAYEVLRVAHD